MNSNYLRRAEKNTHLRILVVDDDPAYGLVLQRLAENEGISLSYYSSVRDAYRDIEKLEFDLAILDFDLGPVTGAQLSNYMASKNVTAPIMLVSGNKVLSTAIPWSSHVKKILSKERGPVGVLYDALRICDAA